MQKLELDITVFIEPLIVCNNGFVQGLNDQGNHADGIIFL